MLKKLFIPHRHNDYKPHILREFSVLVMLLLIVVVFAGSLVVSHFVGTSSLTADIYSAVIVSLTNQDRAATNLSVLSPNPLLAAAAQQKANDMAARGYFSHISPDGLTPWYWMSQAGYPYLYAGENLAVDFTDSNDVERAWMNSPLHRENILNGHFTEIGIGIAKGNLNGRPTTFVVQMFGSPKPTTVVASTPETIVTTSTVTTSSTPRVVIAAIKPKNKVVPAQVITVSSSPTFIAVKSVEGESISPATTETNVATNSVSISSIKSGGNWFERSFSNPAETARNIYLALAAFVILSLLLFIFIEWRIQHPKNIAYGVLILVIILSATYINWVIF